MGGMTRGQIFELAFWSLFAIGAFALSFEFNKPIEIYKYGATGWPRGIICFIVLAVIGQFIHDLRARREDAAQSKQHARPGADESSGIAYLMRVGAILFVPVLYATLMQYAGFYFLTPFFIIAFLLFGGERRIKTIISVTAFLWVLFVLLFGKLLYIGLPIGNTRPFYDFSNWLLVLLS